MWANRDGFILIRSCGNEGSEQIECINRFGAMFSEMMGSQ